MRSTNNTHSYNKISRYLHWIMAFCYLFMFLSAIIWNTDSKWQLLKMPHKAIGIILLFLSIIRIILAWNNHHKHQIKHWTIKLGHNTLYVLMIAVPITGLFKQQTELLHNILAYLFFILIIGHIIFAIIHHYNINKQQPNYIN